jgi:hypothetical protein
LKPKRTLHDVPGHLDRMVNENTIMKHCVTSRADDLLRRIEAWRLVHHVVALPFSGRAGSVDQRRVLAVESSRLGIGRSSIAERIQYLNLRMSENKESAVPTLFPLSPDLHRH